MALSHLLRGILGQASNHGTDTLVLFRNEEEAADPGVSLPDDEPLIRFRCDETFLGSTALFMSNVKRILILCSQRQTEAIILRLLLPQHLGISATVHIVWTDKDIPEFKASSASMHRTILLHRVDIDFTAPSHEVLQAIPDALGVIQWIPMTPDQSLLHLHHDLKGRHFDVAINDVFPFVDVQERSGLVRKTFNAFKNTTVEQHEVSKASGIDIAILHTLSETMNFRWARQHLNGFLVIE